MKVPITMTLTYEVVEWIDSIAGKQNMSRSEVAEILLRQSVPPDPIRDAVARINAAAAELRDLGFEISFDMKRKDKKNAEGEAS